MDFLIQGEIVVFWQYYVQYDQIDGFGLQMCVYLFVVFGGVDLVINLGQVFLKQFMNGGIVINDKN